MLYFTCCVEYTEIVKNIAGEIKPQSESIIFYLWTTKKKENIYLAYLKYQNLQKRRREQSH